MTQNPQLQLPPSWAEQTAAQLSSDIYHPLSTLQAKYPDAQIHESGCDRVMILRLPGNNGNPTQSGIWVVFMGTHNLASLISDFKIKRRPFAPWPGAEVHIGFDDGVQALLPKITSAIHSLDDGHCQLIFTGHSRGATQAEIAAAYCFESWAGPLIAWILPIAPARPGNATFRNMYDVRFGRKSYWYHHGADIVPWQTPWILGNRHVGHRIWWPDVMSGGHGPRMVDPPLEGLAANILVLVGRNWRIGIHSLLGDHHVFTYLDLLNGRHPTTTGHMSKADLSY